MTFRTAYDDRTDPLSGERFDVASFVAKIPKLADLYARSVAESHNRWRNTGDKAGPQ